MSTQNDFSSIGHCLSVILDSPPAPFRHVRRNDVMVETDRSLKAIDPDIRSLLDDIKNSVSVETPDGNLAVKKAAKFRGATKELIDETVSDGLSNISNDLLEAAIQKAPTDGEGAKTLLRKVQSLKGVPSEAYAFVFELTTMQSSESDVDSDDDTVADVLPVFESGELDAESEDSDLELVRERGLICSEDTGNFAAMEISLIFSNPCFCF